jgi:hypothetical protein
MYRIDVLPQPWQWLSEYAHTLRYHRRQESTSTITKSAGDFIISSECIKASGEHHLQSEFVLQF